MDEIDLEPTGEKSQAGWNPYQRARDRLHQSKPQADRLIDDCIHILLKHGLSELNTFSLEERGLAIERIRTAQDPESGLFRGQFDEIEEGGLGIASGSQLRSTGFALLALEAMGEKAIYPLRFLDELEASDGPVAWLESLDWTRVVTTSEQVMYAMIGLIYKCEVEAQPSAARQYHQILDWLEQAQDPKTGLWGMQSGSSLHQAVVAGFHLIPFFEYVFRPVMRVTHILDAALQLRTGSGSLFPIDLQGFYNGLAAASLLATFTNRYPYRREEIRNVLKNSARELLDRQTDDGVFLMLERGPDNLDVRESPSILSDLPESFLLQTWMYLAALTISAHLGEEGLPAGLEGPHWPSFGWLRSGVTLDDHTRAVLPLWLRKPACTDAPGDRDDLPGEIKPTVSVVIPCYNLGTYLYQAIDSVFAQSFKNFEIILVDDGSTDEFTRLAIDSLDCPKTRLVRQENQGLPAARNAGIRLAGGRYICCLDADDRLRPGYFAAAVPYLDSQPEVGFVSGDLKMFDEREGIYRGGDCTLPELLLENRVIVPALFRREAWQKVGGFCETFSASGIEDWDFWISLLEAGYRAQVIPEVLYDYRFRADAMSVGMYVPQTWGRLYRELVERHAPSYQQYIVDVLNLHATRWAVIRQWALDQERAISWWERQSGIWQHTAQDREDWIHQIQDRMNKLEEEIAALHAQLQASSPSQNELSSEKNDQKQADTGNSEVQP